MTRIFLFFLFFLNVEHNHVDGQVSMNAYSRTRRLSLAKDELLLLVVAQQLTASSITQRYCGHQHVTVNPGSSLKADIEDQHCKEHRLCLACIKNVLWLTDTAGIFKYY